MRAPRAAARRALLAAAAIVLAPGLAAAQDDGPAEPKVIVVDPDFVPPTDPPPAPTEGEPADPGDVSPYGKVIEVPATKVTPSRGVALSECVRTRVLSNPGIRSQLEQWDRCVTRQGGEDYQGRVLAPGARSDCDRRAERVRESIADAAGRTCGEQLDPSALGAIEALYAAATQGGTFSTTGMRNDINEQLEEARRGDMAEGETGDDRVLNRIDAYRALGLSDCFETQVLSNYEIREQTKLVAACERGERVPGIPCSQRRRQLRHKMERQAKSRCREALPAGALADLELLLFGVGDTASPSVEYYDRPGSP